MAEIVILGAGIGGIPAAFEIRELLSSQHRITVISDSDTFHFTPSNPWVAVDWRRPAAIKLSLGELFKKHDIAFIPVGAKRLQPERNEIELTDGRRISYDFLVIATGPRLAFEEVEGLGPAGFTQSICHVDHAEHAAQAWKQFVADPGPVVVGAVQGASCFGPAYEFAFIMDSDLRKRKIRHKVPMTFVTSEPYVGHLGLGGVGDSRGMLESEMRDHHIKWICNARVTRVDATTMYVTELDEDGNEKKQHELPYRYSMMLPAFTGIDAVRDIEGLVNPRGFILVDSYQCNPKFRNIYAVGVCVAIPPVEATPVPTGVPKTGYMIESMATATAHNIHAAVNGGMPETEATWNAICLADLGDTGIAFVAIPEMPPRNVNWMKKGKWVHLGKIAFEKYYLRKLKKGASEPFFEKKLLGLIGIERLKRA